MFDLLKRDPNAAPTGTPTTEYVRFFAGLDGKPKLKDSTGAVLDFQSRAFISISGNTGTATAEIVDDTLSLTGVNGISTSATDSPDAIVITPSYGTPVGLAPAGTNASGAANTFARSDHVHATPTAVASSIAPNATSAEGTSTAFARADHIHNLPTAAAASLTGGSASAEGTAASFARSDHTHAISNGGTPTTVTPNAAANQGASTSLARSDHTHAIATAAAVGLSNASTNTEGTSAAFARADHTHAITNLKSRLATAFTSTANSAVAQTVLSLVVPAARIAAGMTLEFELWGLQTNAATSGGNNNVIVTLNGAVAATATVAVGATAQTNRPWVGIGSVSFQSTTLVYASALNTISGVLGVAASNGAAGTTVTAGDVTIALQVQTATANAGNTIKVVTAYLSEV